MGEELKVIVFGLANEEYGIEVEKSPYDRTNDANYTCTENASIH